MKFKKIIQLDPCGLTGEYKEKIFSLSKEKPVIYETFPENKEEIITRINDGDCVLVSWNTRMNAEVLQACPSVKYIGMCCSLYDEKSANVDIPEARKLSIIVKGVRDYGDYGTVEFIFAGLISLFKGLGKYQWGVEPTELTSKTIGIIGMGVLGTMVARTALQFGMTVRYYSRTRKPEMESDGVEYRELDRLLSESDIITTHLPRNTTLLKKYELGLLKENAVYINTSLGEPFEKNAFLEWIGQDSGNYAIFDAAGYSNLKDIFSSYPNIILSEKSSGFTVEAKHRLTEKVWLNMVSYLEKTGCQNKPCEKI
ncbi:MAG: dihydrofolate reductase [Candidatus Azobacteroides sp.]|nr:dihydrofolate reductase [Candidatus Azobacteroides sp.]